MATRCGRLLAAGLVSLGTFAFAAAPLSYPAEAAARVAGHLAGLPRGRTPDLVSTRCTLPANANALVATVLASVNAQRRAKGLAALRPSPVLMQAAQGLACDNAARGGYSHTGVDGSDLRTRLRRVGYRMRVAAENTAFGFDDPDRLVRFWMGSAAHRANILNPGTRDFGLGLAAGSRPAWVLVMGRQG